MRKLMYGSYGCEMLVSDTCEFRTEVACDYEKDTICYATERYFERSKSLHRYCALESYKIRISKGKNQRRQRFKFYIPSILMELPGEWTEVRGFIDCCGIVVTSIRLLAEHPCFAYEDKSF